MSVFSVIAISGERPSGAVRLSSVESVFRERGSIVVEEEFLEVHRRQCVQLAGCGSTYDSCYSKTGFRVWLGSWIFGFSAVFSRVFVYLRKRIRD